MKSCPTCQRTYPDDAPGFCVNDGTRLVAEEAQAFDPQKTVMASTPPPTPRYPEPPPNNPPAPPQYSSPAPPTPPQDIPQAPPVAQPPFPQQPMAQPPMAQQPVPQQPVAQQPPWQSPMQPPPPPPGQNYGAGYPQQQQQAPPWPPPYAPQMEKSKTLSLITLVLGLLSAIGLTILFLIAGEVLESYPSLIMISFWGSAALGLIALIVGIMALLSKRQRGKWMAIVGVLLGLPAVAFCIYALISRPEILSGTFG